MCFRRRQHLGQRSRSRTSGETGLREGCVLERRKKEDETGKVGLEGQAELRVDLVRHGIVLKVL